MVPKTYENILYEKKPPFAYITLNRPEKMNALSAALLVELREVLQDAGWQDKEIRVIIIKGAGRSFSAGFDIDGEAFELGLDDAVKWSEFLRDQHSFWWDLIWNNPKPLIAQVHSYCLAAGMAVACFCDLCICSEDALFGYPMVRTGGPVLAIIWPWILGIRKAKELLYTGNLIDAQEALRLGLVNKVVPRDELEKEVNKMAQTITKVPQSANVYSKRLVNMAYELMNIRPAVERADELEAVLYAATAETHPEQAEFHRIRQEKGLKAALEWRSDRFSEEDAWFRERKKRQS